MNSEMTVASLHRERRECRFVFSNSNDIKFVTMSHSWTGIIHPILTQKGCGQESIRERNTEANDQPACCCEYQYLNYTLDNRPGVGLWASRLLNNVRY